MDLRFLRSVQRVRLAGSGEPVEYVFGDNAGDIPGAAMFFTMSSPSGSDGTPFGHFSLGYGYEPGIEFRGMGKFTEISALDGKTVVAAQLELAAGLDADIYNLPAGFTVNVSRVLVPWIARQEQPFGHCGWVNRGEFGEFTGDVPWDVPGASGLGTDRESTLTGSFVRTVADGSGFLFVIELPPAQVQDMVDNPSSNNGWVFDAASQPADTAAYFHMLTEEADEETEPDVPNAINLRPRLRVLCTD